MSEMRERPKRKIAPRTWLLGALVIVLAGSGLYLLLQDKSNPGLEYILQEESKDTGEISKVLLDRKKNELQTLYESGQLNTASLLSDYVVIGDSRAQAFASAGATDSERTLSTIGVTVADIDNHIEEVQALQPSRIILIYGMNDAMNELINVEGGYGEYYASYVQKLVDVDPGAEIYVSPILDVADAVKAEKPGYTLIPQYNEELKAMCEKYGWTYLDNADLASGSDESIYELDGEHFNYAFIQLWMRSIAEKVMEAESV